MSDEYWIEHAKIAMNDAGIEVTSDQLEIIAGVIEGAHEFYGQAHGHDVVSSNYHAEKEREQKQEIRNIEKEHERILANAEKMRKQLIAEKEALEWKLYDERRKREENQ